MHVNKFLLILIKNFNNYLSVLILKTHYSNILSEPEAGTHDSAKKLHCVPNIP